MKKKIAVVPDHAAIYKDIHDAQSRPFMPRHMTLLNTTRVQGRPAKGTTNTTLGIYSSGPSAEIQMLDMVAKNTLTTDGWLKAPRHIKVLKVARG